MTNLQSQNLPSLPQNVDPQAQTARAFDVSLARTSYNYMFSYIESLSISADVPKGEGFSVEYNVKVLEVFLPLVNNFKDVIVALLEKEIADDFPGEAIASVKAVEVAYAKLKQDMNSHNPLSLIKEIADIKELLEALSQVPHDIEQGVKAVARIPKDLLKLVTGLDAALKQFETEGFSSFLKNSLYDILDTSEGRNYLKAKNVQDYELLFSGLPTPQNLSIAEQSWMNLQHGEQPWQQDWYFGYMQIGGFNTTNLLGVQLDNKQSTKALLLADLLAKMPLTDSIFQQVIGNASMTLIEAAKKGLLYVCDYSMFDGIPGSELHELKRYPAAPIAVFYWNAAPPKGYPPTGAMQPVAIQIGQSYHPNTTPIFTPNDCTNNNDANRAKWQVAKYWVQNACAVQHETVAHLGACHLTIEPMIVAANRQLPQQHPLMVLLKPHFRFTLQINDDAIHSLIVPGGVVASVLSPSIQGSAELLVRANQAWALDEQFPDRLFSLRGVSADTLENFPFRQDTLDLWQSIKQFVRAYLSLYYVGDTSLESDQQVSEDYELQNWVNEMVNPKFAAIKGMSGLVETNDAQHPYKIESFNYLVEVTALIIYTASAQHAAVNYAQYPLMSYIPSVSGTVYAEPPTCDQQLTQESYLQWLPPLDVALYQLSFGYLLSSVQFDTLGKYSNNPRINYFADPKVAPLVTEFQLNLSKVELAIHQRNANRPFPYLFQLPSMVPNSISI